MKIIKNALWGKRAATCGLNAAVQPGDSRVVSRDSRVVACGEHPANEFGTLRAANGSSMTAHCGSSSALGQPLNDNGAVNNAMDTDSYVNFATINTI